jgi:arabinofuranan 3-O-arabinosyltransferase
MILPPTLIEECEHRLTDHQALVIPEVSIGKGFWARCKSAERQLYIEGNDLVEAARCFQKEAFLSLGGYNSRLEAGEDWDLHDRARRRGLTIGRVRSRIIHDEGNLTLAAILKKKFFYGKALGEYFRLNPQVGIRQANPINRLLTPSLKSIRSDPVHGVGILLLKSLEFTAVGLGHLKGIFEGKPVTMAAL